MENKKTKIILVSLLITNIIFLFCFVYPINSSTAAYLYGEDFNMYFEEDNLLYIGQSSNGLIELAFNSTFNSSNCILYVTSYGGHLIFDNYDDVELSIELDNETLGDVFEGDFYLNVSVPSGSTSERIDDYKYDLSIPSAANNYIYWDFYADEPFDYNFWFVIVGLITFCAITLYAATIMKGRR